MNKIIVLGSDGIIFNIGVDESSFDYVLEYLGKGKESRKLEKEYIKGKSKGPLLLKDKVALFKGISKENIEKAVKKYLKNKLRKEFSDFVKELKSRGYLVSVFSSNPFLVYNTLSGVDFVFATELEFENEICTGKYKELEFSEEILQKLRAEYPILAQNITKEPNRYGLAIKLFELVKEKNINVESSYIIRNKITAVPMLEIIKNAIVFGQADKEISQQALYVKPDSLKNILEVVR